MSTMKFCGECNNLLCPKEDKERKILLYACRTCDYQEEADNNCVYRNEVNQSVFQETQILRDVVSDPTYPRTKAVCCKKCQHREAVYYHDTSRGEEAMTLVFVCSNPSCDHYWIE